MSSDNIERSESGGRVYRHKSQERQWTLPQSSCEHLQEIEKHIEKYVGKIETVYHELLSDLIHLDVLFVRATEERPFHLMVTSGVSDEPMNVPEGMENFQRAELIMALPPTWPLFEAEFKEENNYWPIRWLKYIGRLPHEYKTWIGWGHTIPNGDPAEPIANTNFTGVILLPPYWLPTEFFQLNTQANTTICFYDLVPLYQEELDLKLKKGSEELEKRFEKQNINFILDTQRKNVAKQKGWFGR